MTNNELGINTLTMSALFRVMAEGREILFNLCLRDGATVDMAVERVQHYIYAQVALASGVTQAKEERRTVTQYNDPVTHSEARVPLYGLEWVHPQRANDFSPQVNKFTEFASAQDILDRAAMFNKIRAVLELGCEPPIKTDAPAGVIPAPATKSAQGATVMPAPKVVDGFILGDHHVTIVSWDNRQREQYEQLFVGKPVEIRISTVGRYVKAKKDGSGHYEVIDFFSYYEGEPSQYPCYALSVFVGDNYDYKALVKAGIEQLLPEPGKEYAARGIVRFKISAKEDKVYWNFRKLEFEEPPVFPEPPDSDPEVAEDDPPIVAGDAIPW
jgi:hypothetical protein